MHWSPEMKVLDTDLEIQFLTKKRTQSHDCARLQAVHLPIIHFQQSNMAVNNNFHIFFGKIMIFYGSSIRKREIYFIGWAVWFGLDGMGLDCIALEWQMKDDSHINGFVDNSPLMDHNIHNQAFVFPAFSPLFFSVQHRNTMENICEHFVECVFVIVCSILCFQRLSVLVFHSVYPFIQIIIDFMFGWAFLL